MAWWDYEIPPTAISFISKLITFCFTSFLSYNIHMQPCGVLDLGKVMINKHYYYYYYNTFATYSSIHILNHMEDMWNSSFPVKCIFIIIFLKNNEFIMILNYLMAVIFLCVFIMGIQKGWYIGKKNNNMKVLLMWFHMGYMPSKNWNQPFIIILKMKRNVNLILL